MMTTTDFILRFANTFLKKAQSQEHDYSFVEKIRQSPQLGKKIEAEAGKALQDNAISRLDIRVSWNKPNVEFEVYAMGADADKVDESLKALLDAKYSKLMAAALSRQPTQSFRFGLMTLPD
jgi:hypothetical protein